MPAFVGGKVMGGLGPPGLVWVEKRRPGRLRASALDADDGVEETSLLATT